MSVHLPSALTFLLVAALVPWLYARLSLVLVLNYTNDPVRLPRFADFKSSHVRFADQIRNCEDVVLLESRKTAILACDPGRDKWNTVMGLRSPEVDPNAGLYLFKYADPSLPASEALVRLKLVGFENGQRELRTLGIAFDEEQSRLYVTNHRHEPGPLIEVFTLDLDAARADHLFSIAHPLIHGPNSIAIVDASSFLVTNDHYFPARDYPLLSVVETYSGSPTGTVVYVRVLDSANVDAKVVLRLPFPNGIDFFNATTVAVASTNTAAVHLFEFTPASAPASSSFSSFSSSYPTLTRQGIIKVPFLPDNLSVDKRGALLITGHGSPRLIAAFAASRSLCARPEEAPARADHHTRQRCEAATAPSRVSEWTEAHGLRHLYSGTEFASACTAVRDTDFGAGILSGLYERGVLVWQE